MVSYDKFNGCFCPSVRICWPDWAVLRDRYHIRESSCVAINGRGRGEYDIGHIMLRHAAEESDCASDINTVVLERDFGGLAHGLKRYKLALEPLRVVICHPLCYKLDHWVWIADF